MQSQLHNKINNLVEDGKVYEYAGRCWYTCYMTWLKLKKDEKLRTKMVKGKSDYGTHYWLELDGKEVVDVHYKLCDKDLDVEQMYSYEKEVTLNLYDCKVDKSLYEKKPSVNWNGRLKESKVWDLQHPLDL